MATTTKNGARVPTGSDPYALTADLRKMMESAGLAMPVTSQAQRDGIPSPFTGMLVIRLDRLGSLEYFDGSAWVPASAPLPPIGHLGKTNGFTRGNGGAVLMDTAQVLRGGFKVQNNGLVIPRTGLYEIRLKIYVSGGNMGSHGAIATLNTLSNETGVAARWNKTAVDETNNAAGVRLLKAGDLLMMRLDGPAAPWGTDGYNGTYLEAVYVGPSENY